MSKYAMTNSSCRFLFFSPVIASDRNRNPSTGKGFSKCYKRVCQIHICRSVRLLSNQSSPDEGMSCIALVRKDQTCPNRSETLLFHGSVLSRCVHFHLDEIQVEPCLMIATLIGWTEVESFAWDGESTMHGYLPIPI